MDPASTAGANDQEPGDQAGQGAVTQAAAALAADHGGDWYQAVGACAAAHEYLYGRACTSAALLYVCAELVGCTPGVVGDRVLETHEVLGALTDPFLPTLAGGSEGLGGDAWRERLDAWRWDVARGVAAVDTAARVLLEDLGCARGGVPDATVVVTFHHRQALQGRCVEVITTVARAAAARGGDGTPPVKRRRW